MGILAFYSHGEGFVNAALLAGVVGVPGVGFRSTG